MDKSVRRYLSEIGRCGGKKSKRKLDSETARRMVAVREARRIYRSFYVKCFWSYDPNYKITAKDIPWVIEQLMKNGDRFALEAAKKLCRLQNSK
ncbi:MAG: hypothetical protein D6780_03615, partial [Candidatus Dadabacteria bacterium]